MSEMENHPASSLFPMMRPEEMTGLLQDIKEHGLREPITLFEGKVLDGRNRLSACESAGVAPRFENFNNGSPVLYVLSKNLHRRHLTDDQLGAIGADSIPLLQAEARKRQAHGLTAPGRTLPAEPPEAIQANRINVVRGDTRSIAANQVGVSNWKVRGALAVKKESPEVFGKLKSGEISLPQAKRELSGEGKTNRQDQIENAAKNRMVTCLSQIKGICSGLREMDTSKLAGPCTKKELKTWKQISFDAAKDLRAFGSKLSKEVEKA